MKVTYKTSCGRGTLLNPLSEVTMLLTLSCAPVPLIVAIWYNSTITAATQFAVLQKKIL